MKYLNETKEHYTQFLYTLFTYPQAVSFIRIHKIWSGFWKYSWASKILIVAAILSGLKFLQSIVHWFDKADTSDPLAAMSVMGTMMVDVVSREYEYLTSGSMRYLMIILVEIVIFHVSRKTLEILINKESDSTMKAFIHAQIRMIKVAFFCYVMEMVFGLGTKAVFGVFGAFQFLQPAALFLIQVFFMGFAVLDNYLEQFNLTIKESFKYTRNFIGVALGCGLSMQLFFLVPVMGPVIAPFLAAVTATIAMVELSDLHLRPALKPIPVEEEVYV